MALINLIFEKYYHYYNYGKLLQCIFIFHKSTDNGFLNIKGAILKFKN